MCLQIAFFAIPTEVAGEFIADIFGRRTGGCTCEGLVDSRSEEDFDATLKQLELFGSNVQMDQSFSVSSLSIKVM